LESLNRSGLSKREALISVSPPDSVRETEDHPVELSQANVLELEIVPDESGGEVSASLVSLRET
jgi:hypothetical protein